MKGIGPKRRQKIKDAWAEHKVIREIMVFLHSNQEKTGKELAPSQRETVRQALTSRALIITGGPGVGKITLVNAILLILRAKKVRCLLCASTGRAAKRLLKTIEMEAKTIHRILEVNPAKGGFSRIEVNPLECDLLVVDETSMVDVTLMSYVLSAVPPNASLLLVGGRGPVAVGRPWDGATPPHREQGGASGAVDVGIPASGPQPDHHQRPPDQRRIHARTPRQASRVGFLFHRPGGVGADRHHAAGGGQNPDSTVKWFRPPRVGRLFSRSRTTMACRYQFHRACRVCYSAYSWFYRAMPNR